MTKGYYADMYRYTLNGQTFHLDSGPHDTREEAAAAGPAYLDALGYHVSDFNIYVGLFDIPPDE